MSAPPSASPQPPPPPPTSEFQADGFSHMGTFLMVVAGVSGLVGGICKYLSFSSNAEARMLSTVRPTPILDIKRHLIQKITPGEFEASDVFAVQGKTWCPPADRVPSLNGAGVIKQLKKEVQQTQTWYSTETKVVDPRTRVERTEVKWHERVSSMNLASNRYGNNVHVIDGTFAGYPNSAPESRSSSLFRSAAPAPAEPEQNTLTIPDSLAEELFVDGTTLFEPHKEAGGTTNISVNVASSSTERPKDRIIGIQISERIIPVDKPIFALGEVVCSRDHSNPNVYALSLRRSPGREVPYMLRYGTEKEILDDANGSAHFYNTSSSVFLALAAAFGVGGVSCWMYSHNIRRQ